MRSIWMALAVLAGCATPAPRRILDLSPILDASNGTRIEPKGMEKPIYLGMAEITLFNHAGSHYDPPNHVIRGAAGADRAPLERLVAPARVLDFRAKERTAGLARADFEGKVRAGDFVIAFGGCQPRQPCPYLTKEGAEFLASLPVSAFGTDNWTIANATPERMRAFRQAAEGGQAGTVEEWAPEHFALLSKDIPVVEGLAGLEPLLAEPAATIVALPLKVKDADGAPARVIALVW